MLTRSIRGARALTAGTLIGLVTACAEAPTTPPLAAPDDPAFALEASGFSVLHVHLRPAEGSESTAWGELTVFVGALHPPNPCVRVEQNLTVIVCGVIHNPGGEPLTSGFLTVLADGNARPVEHEFALPPNPCLTYLIRASSAADLGAEGLGLPAVQAVFTLEPGTIVSVEGTPGPPNDPSAGRGADATSPDAPPNPCVVGFATRQG